MRSAGFTTLNANSFAKGLLRTYYNDYTGTIVFGGCSTSFNTVKGIIDGANTWFAKWQFKNSQIYTALQSD